MTIELISVWQSIVIPNLFRLSYRILIVLPNLFDSHAELKIVIPHSNKLSYRNLDSHTELRIVIPSVMNCHTQQQLILVIMKMKTEAAMYWNISSFSENSRTSSRQKKRNHWALNLLRAWFLVLTVKSKPLEIFVLFLCNHLADYNP